MLDDILQRRARFYSGVLSGLGGIVWHGMSLMFRDIYWFATTDKSLEQLYFLSAAFVYVPEIDRRNFLGPCPYNPGIYIPTPERSIVTYQRDEAMVPYDDEQLMFSMQEYSSRHQGDNRKLLKVAEFYGRRAEIEKSWEISKDFDSEYS